MNSPNSILYIGNYLTKPGINPTFNFSLVPRLRENFNVLATSDKERKLSRIIDMVMTFFKGRHTLDVVMIDVYSGYGFWYAVILARMARLYHIPYINLLHGGNLPSRLIKSAGLSKSLFGHAARNISPSVYLQDIFAKAGFDVEYLPNFIDIEKYPYRERSHVSVSLFWLRSFHKIYNPILAVRVLKALVDKGYDARLCMVGPDKDGTLRDVAALAEKLKLANRLDITGQLSTKDWISLSENYDIFINTTDFDNRPVSVLEAMALGMPIVSTNVGGLPFLIDDGINGILIPPDDADAFANAIIDMVSHPEKTARLSHNAREKAETFTWSALKDKWIEVISNTVGV